MWKISIQNLSVCVCIYEHMWKLDQTVKLYVGKSEIKRIKEIIEIGLQ